VLREHSAATTGDPTVSATLDRSSS
jgi:hypothetical protein